MQKILSIVLSFTLLFNTLAPSFAGVPRRVRKPKLDASVFTRKGQSGTLEKIACANAAKARIREKIVAWRKSIASVPTQTLRISVDFSLGKYEGLGKEILSMPIPDKTLMRNELVGLFLTGELTPYQRGQTLSYFQESLAGAKQILGAVSVPEKYLITSNELIEQGLIGKLPGGRLSPARKLQSKKELELQGFFDSRFQEFSDWVKQDPAVNETLDLLADAAALGIMGGEKDIPSLMELYEASIGTPFEPMAGTIILHSFLRLKSYNKLSAFLENLKYPTRGYINDFVSKILNNSDLMAGLNTALIEQMVDAITPGEISAGKFYKGLNEEWAEYLEKAFNGEFGKRGPLAVLVAQNHAYEEWPGMECIEVEPDWAAIQKDEAEHPQPFPVTQASQPEGSTVAENSSLDQTNVFPVLVPTPEIPVESMEDFAQVFNPHLVPSISVQGTGFKFTLENANGETLIPNVNIAISEGIKAAKFSRVTINKEGTIELRGEGQKNSIMGRFYFRLSPGKGALNTLVKGMAAFPHNTLYIKLVSNKTKGIKQEFSQIWNRLARSQATIVSIPLYDSTRRHFVIAGTDISLLPKECIDRGLNGIFIVRNDQVFYEDGEGSYLLKDFHVRLPKKFRNIWVPIMRENAQQPFSLEIFPTQDKTFIMKYIVPMLQVGTGKAFGPIMNSLGLPHWLADGLPMFANNGMPVFLAPLMSSLRRFGDANLYRAGIGLYALTSLGALSFGLNGFMGVENAAIAQVIGLCTILLGMGAGNVLTRTNQNNLIRQNEGEILAPKAKRKKLLGDSTQAPSFGFLTKRLKEIFTKKPTNKRSSILYQKPSAMKNVGTFLFLFWPTVYNTIAMLVDSSSRADFSLSFWWLGGLSLYALFESLRLPLKDTFIRNAGTLELMLENKEIELLKTIKTELDKPQEKQDFSAIAQELRKIISPLAQAISFKSGAKEEGLCEGLEWTSISRLVDLLKEEGVSLQQEDRFVQALKKQFDSLDRRNVNYKDIFKIPGIKSAFAGMTLLTAHELGTSLSFAYAVNTALEKAGIGGAENITLGSAISAFFLYGTAFLSRLLGNVLAARVRDGTMYLFSSLCSLVGTGLMVGANGNFNPLLTGAILAGFGMGNFFAQVFEHTVGLDEEKKYAAEIAQIITMTMPVAALLSSQLPTIASAVGMPGLDLKICFGLLLGGLWATKKMFVDSSLVESMQYYLKKIKNIFSRSKPSENLLNDARPLPESQDILEDVQEGLPVDEENPAIPSKYRVPVHG